MRNSINNHKVHDSTDNLAVFPWGNNQAVTTTKELPPPPCRTESGRLRVHESIELPLPPCTFQLPPSRSSSFRKAIIRITQPNIEDPFVTAIKTCTKTSSNDTSCDGKSRFNLTKNKYLRKLGSWRSKLSFSSCKSVWSSVRDGNLVQISHLPYEDDQSNLRRTSSMMMK